ncbi:LuxE/PaaK family acyltransferase [Rhizosphaericola mali]|uniref:Acyl transferase n=1 Tax=Rhizosphaericola mali TaxID=2545455 RepID=A0A5P2G7M6_9BACT|nr:acyl transferase [Rhizosphaericola mali]QES87521.1 acyl transferase [Rhizosphaericola mali]
MDNLDIDFLFSGQKISDEIICNIFRFQYSNNEVYQQWCNLLKRTPETIKSVDEIPYLPISFFKSHTIKSGIFEPELTFESSGTTQTTNSHHYIKYASIYEKSFFSAFELFYGSPKDWCILGLLPAYLERSNSSLVKMANDLIVASKHPDSGFYLYDFEKLSETIKKLEATGQKTILLGVTFALLDFAESFPMPLKNTIIMETGGMKGRKKEITRQEVHGYLKQQFQVENIHSEYGMTELLSQAYSHGNGIYVCPPWMKVSLRDESDPLTIKHQGQGILNIMDLANIYSVSFIATDDVGRIYTDGSFDIQGRLDRSDLRGCSLLTISE